MKKQIKGNRKKDNSKTENKKERNAGRERPTEIKNGRTKKERKKEITK